jgi:nucleoside 2-deoxyribosyltransferase
MTNGTIYRVYVAGAYSADNVMDVLRNIGKGQKACAEVFRLGFAPFCPWHDKTYVYDNPDVAFTVEDFYKFSMAWLEVSDAVLVLPNFQKSKGTLAEIEHAEKLGIPVFYNTAALIAAKYHLEAA